MIYGEKFHQKFHLMIIKKFFLFFFIFFLQTFHFSHCYFPELIFDFWCFIFDCWFFLNWFWFFFLNWFSLNLCSYQNKRSNMMGNLGSIYELRCAAYFLYVFTSLLSSPNSLLKNNYLLTKLHALCLQMIDIKYEMSLYFVVTKLYQMWVSLSSTLHIKLLLIAPSQLNNLGSFSLIFYLYLFKKDYR